MSQQPFGWRLPDKKPVEIPMQDVLLAMHRQFALTMAWREGAITDEQVTKLTGLSLADITKFVELLTKQAKMILECEG